MDVKLDAETEKLVQKEMETGRFPDACRGGGYVALQHYLMAREFGEEYTRAEIDGKIARGLAQLDAGQGVDGEEFFERAEAAGPGFASAPQMNAFRLSPEASQDLTEIFEYIKDKSFNAEDAETQSSRRNDHRQCRGQRAANEQVVGTGANDAGGLSTRAGAGSR